MNNQDNLQQKYLVLLTHTHLTVSIENASHNNNRYTCECEGWKQEMQNDVIETLEYEKKRCIRLEYSGSVEQLDEQISYMKGLLKQEK